MAGMTVVVQTSYCQLQEHTDLKVNDPFNQQQKLFSDLMSKYKPYTRVPKLLNSIAHVAGLITVSYN